MKTAAAILMVAFSGSAFSDWQSDRQQKWDEFERQQQQQRQQTDQWQQQQQMNNMQMQMENQQRQMDKMNRQQQSGGCGVFGNEKCK